jgi:anion-transporting  ArsA/GET3 family ATPase
VTALAAFGIPMKHLIVNRVISSERHDCPFCLERWQGQREYLQEIEASFPTHAVLKVLDLPQQVRGVKMLRAFPRLAGVIRRACPTPSRA